ncbi:hypothetical protein NBRC116493_07100 [Aurantivibrio infirmus]
MKLFKVAIFLIGAASIFLSAAASADYGHIHLAAPEPNVAAQWYAKHFGGSVAGFAGETGQDIPVDRVMYGSIPVIFQKRENSPGSVGSGVDHIGFSMANVEDKFASLIADGAKSLGELRSFGSMTIGFVEDPWGTKIELIDDAELRGLHHIHLSSPQPTDTLNWYAVRFGGELGKFKGALDGINYDNKLWLLVSQAKTDVAGTQGRSLDHLGYNVANLDEAAISLKQNNVKFTLEPRDYRGIRIAFVEGPDGVRIELVQP